MLAYTPKGTPLTTEALAAVDNVHGLLEAGEGCITMSHMVWCMGHNVYRVEPSEAEETIPYLGADTHG